MIGYLVGGSSCVQQEELDNNLSSFMTVETGLKGCVLNDAT